MTATAHGLVAGAIAARFGNPAIALPLAFVSHFAMDCIPHWDFGTNWRNRPKYITGIFAIIETLIGLLLPFLLFSKTVPWSLLIPVIIISLLPDWLETPWYIFFAHQKKKEPSIDARWPEKLAYYIYKLENRFHRKAQYPFGVLTQIVTVLFFIAILAK